MAVKCGDHGLVAVLDLLRVHAGHKEGIVADNLGGTELVDLIRQLPLRLHLSHQKIACADIGNGNTEPLVDIDDAHQVVVLRLIQRLGAGNGSGGDDTDDLSLNQPLGQLRVLHLLCDRYFIALLDQPVQIIFKRMVRNAAHRRPFLQPAFFSCQGNLQFLGDGQRVFKKHLIKISQPVKQDTVRVLFLGFQIMDHHW